MAKRVAWLQNGEWVARRQQADQPGGWVGTDENLNHWDGGRGDRWESCSRGGTGSQEEGRSGMTLECLA